QSSGRDPAITPSDHRGRVRSGRRAREDAQRHVWCAVVHELSRDACRGTRGCRLDRDAERHAPPPRSRRDGAASETRRDLEIDGGCLTNQGIHYVDALLWLLGDVESVFAYKTAALARVEVEDTLVASLRFANGALGQIEVTTAARPEDFEAEISVLGEEGTAVIAGLASNRLTVWTPDPAICPRYSEEVPNAYGFGHRPFYRDVVNELVDGVPHPISFADGERAVRLLNAIYRSTEDGAPVRLD